MKKLLIVSLMVVSMMFAGNAFACQGDGCPESVSVYPQANPFDSFDEDFSTDNSYGRAIAVSDGHIGVSAYAQGTKGAWVGLAPWKDKADPTATGTATTDGGAFEIKDPGNFIVAGIGAYSHLTLDGHGTAVGKDYRAYGPDYAGVDIDVNGYVGQETYGMTVVNPMNYFGGSQYSEAGFSGYSSRSNGSYDYHGHPWWNGYRCYDFNFPAIASNRGGADALAAGGTIGGIQKTADGVRGGVITANFAGWDTNGMNYGSQGYVNGMGTAQLGIASQNNGSWGAVNGTADFCYSGYNNGFGIAGVTGNVSITSTGNSSTVTSTANAFAFSKVGGGRGFQD